MQLSSAVDRISSVLFRLGTENMCSLEKPSKLLPVDPDVIVKLPEIRQLRICGDNIFRDHQGIYISTKELVDKIIHRIINSFWPEVLLKEGIELAMLEPGKPWVKGKIKFNISYEFIPDEPEITSESPLDDIRKAMNC